MCKAFVSLSIAFWKVGNKKLSFMAEYIEASKMFILKTKGFEVQLMNCGRLQKKSGAKLITPISSTCMHPFRND